MKRLSVSAFKERIQIRSADTRSCAQLVCEVMCDAKTVFFPGALCLVDNVPVILRGRWADFNWQVQAKKAFICQQNNCLARHRCDVPMTRCARYNTQMLKRCSWEGRGGGDVVWSDKCLFLLSIIIIITKTLYFSGATDNVSSSTD